MTGRMRVHMTPFFLCAGSRALAREEPHVLALFFFFFVGFPLLWGMKKVSVFF